MYSKFWLLKFAIVILVYFLIYNVLSHFLNKIESFVCKQNKITFFIIIILIHAVGLLFTKSLAMFLKLIR